jgi:hypothetical protein
MKKTECIVNKDKLEKERSAYKKLVFAFLDLTDGMERHDFFRHMGGTQERADEIADLRDKLLDLYAAEWLTKARNKQ